MLEILNVHISNVLKIVEIFCNVIDVNVFLYKNCDIQQWMVILILQHYFLKLYICVFSTLFMSHNITFKVLMVHAEWKYMFWGLMIIFQILLIKIQYYHYCNCCWNIKSIILTGTQNSTDFLPHLCVNLSILCINSIPKIWRVIILTPATQHDIDNITHRVPIGLYIYKC